MTGDWVDVPDDVRVAFPSAWTWSPGGSMLDGQLVQAVHGPTGGGAVVRFDPIGVDSLPERVKVQLGDVDAALAADRYAMALAASQTDGSADRTLYLGLSDVAGVAVGRWVFTEPAHPGSSPAGSSAAAEPARVWWHAVWRTSKGFAQLVAWVPESRIDAFLPAMRELETDLGTVSGATFPGPLLWRSTGACDGPADVDRMRAVASTSLFSSAKTRLAAGSSGDPSGSADGWTSTGRAEAELQALGALVSAADACVRPSAKDVRACTVYERSSSTDRSARLQTAETSCIETSAAKNVEAALTVR